MTKKYKGIWFYGLSGSGKTYVSKILYKKINNSVLVDGDVVRKLISFDLGYTQSDREIQIKRVFGISKLIINSKKFPIISTVYFSKKLNFKCLKNKIIPIKISRDNFDKIFKKHRTYKNKKNVVGKDLKYPKLKTFEITNNNKKNFISNNKILKKLGII